MTKKILLADDSITIQKVVRITLADGDYNLISVDNGAEALERLKTESPDLVLADVVMPGKDGYQVCEEIKKNPNYSHIPVVLLAGSFEGFDEIKGAEVGADGFIIKPFESQALISKVEEMLSKPRAKVKKVEEPAQAKTMPRVAAPGPAPSQPLDSEVKDFMDDLSSEMDQPKDIPQMTELPAEEPVAEPVQTVEPAPESAFQEDGFSQEAPVAEPVLEEQTWPAPEPAAQAWEAQPLEGEPAAGEILMDAEPVTEEELWAEPVAEETSAGGPALEAEPVAAEPVGEWAPEPEMQAEAQADYGEASIETTPIAEAVVMAEPWQGIAGSAGAVEEPLPEVGVMGPSAAVHARIAESAEEIATAAASGLSRTELVELIRATVERVAWEVVPEMAEALIKERITRWEVQTQ